MYRAPPVRTTPTSLGHSKSLFALVPRQLLEPRGRQNAGLRHSTLSLPLGTTLSGASARTDPLQPPGDNAIHPASFAFHIGSPGRSSSRLERPSPQAHACLERTLVAHRRPTAAVCSGPRASTGCGFGGAHHTPWLG